MKVSLEFSLPEEVEDHEAALNGHIYKRAIEEFDEELRRRMKYQDQETIGLEEARTLLREIVVELKA